MTSGLTSSTIECRSRLLLVPEGAVRGAISSEPEFRADARCAALFVPAAAFFAAAFLAVAFLAVVFVAVFFVAVFSVAVDFVAVALLEVGFVAVFFVARGAAADRVPPQR